MLLNLTKRIKSIADTGLLYNTNNYDRERYMELLEISHEMMSTLIDQPVETVKNFYAPNKDYPTPKVDIRGLVLNELGEVVGEVKLEKGFDILDAGWFLPDDLPVLSEERILQSQIELLYQKVKTGDTTAYFD